MGYRHVDYGLPAVGVDEQQGDSVPVPEYNWYAVFRLEYLVHFNSLYPVLFHKRVMRVYYGVCAAFILSTFVFDTKTYSACARTATRHG